MLTPGPSAAPKHQHRPHTVTAQGTMAATANETLLKAAETGDVPGVQQALAECLAPSPKRENTNQRRCLGAAALVTWESPSVPFLSRATPSLSSMSHPPPLRVPFLSRVTPSSMLLQVQKSIAPQSGVQAPAIWRLSPEGSVTTPLSSPVLGIPVRVGSSRSQSGALWTWRVFTQLAFSRASLKHLP